MTKHYCEVCGRKLPEEWGCTQKHRDMGARVSGEHARVHIWKPGQDEPKGTDLVFEEVCTRCADRVLELLDELRPSDA